MNQAQALILVLIAFAFLPLPTMAEELENVRINLLTPDVAAAGLRVFKSDHEGEMDRSKVAALMNRAAANPGAPDGVIESASGSTVTIKLTGGGTASLKYDEAAHAWDGQIWVVVLPQ